MKLLLPKNCINIPQNWLRFEILDLLKYPLKLDKFVLLHADDEDNELLCICRFEKEYEKDSKLSGYFSKHEINEELHKIFSDIKYLGEMDVERYEKLSTDDEVLQFSILAEPNYNQEPQNKDISPPTTPSTITPEHSEASQPSLRVISAASTGDASKTIYRVGKTDTFACYNCKQRGDKWYMRQHLPCSNNGNELGR